MSTPEQPVDRRGFLRLAGAGTGGAGALALAGTAPASAEQPAQPARGKRALMKVGCQRGPTTDDLLQYFAQFGVKNICGILPRSDPKTPWTVAEIEKLKKSAEARGISVDMLALPLSNRPVSQAENPNILLGKSPERDREIDTICGMIRTAAKAGIPALKYNLTLLGVVRTERTPGRGGASYSTFVYDKARQDTLTEAGKVSADEFWERISYFLKRVVPVAEECKVRLACHPHDPPMPADKGFRGVQQVLGSVEGLKRFVETQPSPYHGLNFCQGTICEGLENPGKEILDVIRWFGSRKKIFNVHFRNIRGKFLNFQETYPDDGDVDMLQALKVYKEVGYDGMVMPDHMPQTVGDSGGRQAFAFGYGYIKALIQAVDALA
jgi:mannonate dehydratase